MTHSPLKYLVEREFCVDIHGLMKEVVEEEGDHLLLLGLGVVCLCLAQQTQGCLFTVNAH